MADIQNKIENERALRLRESQRKDAESKKARANSAGARLGMIEMGFMFFFSLLADTVVWLIAFIPVVGWILVAIIKIVSWLIVALWVLSRGFKRPLYTMLTGSASVTWTVLIIAKHNNPTFRKFRGLSLVNA